jgi:hypothetical protein
LSGLVSPQSIQVRIQETTQPSMISFDRNVRRARVLDACGLTRRRFRHIPPNRNGEMAGSATNLLTASMIVGRC